MNHPDVEYLNLIKKIMDEGVVKEDRTGTGTIEIFGGRLEFDLHKGFPLLTTKKLSFKNIAEELFWFVSGSTNLKDLLDKNVNIWNADGYRFYKEQGGELDFEGFKDYVRENGFDLGPIYGYNFRRWEGANGKIVDQLNNAIQSIKTQPYSRRHVLTLWNPTVLDEIALPSCHGTAIQFNVTEGKLSCQMYQRSSDSFLGLPYNIASYALLTYIIAKITDLDVGKLVIVTGSTHLYLNHIEQAKLQLTREPREVPTLVVKKKHDKIEDYTMDDLELKNYNPHPAIRAKLSVGL